jgi:RNA-binding motif X-linked protein 2
MNVVNEILRINDLELTQGLAHTPASWHTQYKDCAWIYIGNLPDALTEGDVLCILSQFGEIDDIHLVRDKDSGKSKGFAFVKYQDSRSCILAVDNLTGSEVLGRTLRVDHVEKYRLPKNLQEKEDNDNGTYGPASSAENATGSGHAYEGQELASSFDIHQGQDLFAPVKEERKKAAPGEEDRPVVGGEIVIDDAAEKEERRRRKEARAQKRREKEEHRRKKEEKKRRKHDKQDRH